MADVNFKRRNSEALADLICGNAGSDAPSFNEEPKYFPYRSSMYVTTALSPGGTSRITGLCTDQTWRITSKLLHIPNRVAGQYD